MSLFLFEYPYHITIETIRLNKLRAYHCFMFAQIMSIILSKWRWSNISPIVVASVRQGDNTNNMISLEPNEDGHLEAGGWMEAARPRTCHHGRL